MKATCLYDFDAQKKGQLGFRHGEELLVIREDTGMAGWGFAKNVLNQEGFVPLSYLSIVKQNAPTEKADLEPSFHQKNSASLLEWVQGRIPHCHVQNFGSSWRDGRALMALCNALRPGTFDLPSEFSGTPEENAAKAIAAAEKLLDIPATIAPSELCDSSLAPERLELYVRSFMAKQREMLDKADVEERKQRRKGGLYKESRSKPDKSEVWCNIVSKTGRYHASISFDGVVTDRVGEIMGYINLDTLQAASKAQELVGYLLEGSLYDCRTGGEGVFCGELHRGHGSIHDKHGSTLVEVDATGACRGQTKVYLGCFEECTRQELPVIALYVMFIDPDFVDETYEDEPERQLVEIPEAGFCNVYDKEGKFRASICAEGVVRDCFGDVMGYLDLEAKRAASAKSQLLASILGTQVIGPEDEMLGDLDRGRGLVYDANGSSVLSLDAAGHAKGATQVYLGEFRGCSYADLEVIALYILAIDKDFVNENQ